MHPTSWPVIIVVFALVLGIMVLVHEFGHFIVAKAFGVRVEAFAIGFGPRLFGYVYKGTDYRINALPLGGYVKMAGEYTGTSSRPGVEAEHTVGETEMMWSPDADRSGHGAPDEFPSKPRWQRVCIALAGPFANFVLAFLLLGLVYTRHHEVQQYRTGPAVVDYVPRNTPAARNGMGAGDTIIDFNGKQNPTWDTVLEEVGLHLHRDLPVTFLHNGAPVSAVLSTHTGTDPAEFGEDALLDLGLIPQMQTGPIVVDSLTGGLPAERAGLQRGDRIFSIDGLRLHSVIALLPYLADHNGAPDTLEIDRNGQPLTLTITPQATSASATQPLYKLGFGPAPVPTYVEKLPASRALAESWRDNKHDSTLILRVLKGMFTRQVSVRSLSGPVGMAQQIGFALSMGIWTVLQLMCTISINLGIFNLLPIPILDGGMILFLLIEGTLRRDLSLEIKERVYQVAFVCLILFAAFVMFNDITKLHHI